MLSCIISGRSKNRDLYILLLQVKINHSKNRKYEEGQVDEELPRLPPSLPLEIATAVMLMPRLVLLLT